MKKLFLLAALCGVFFVQNVHADHVCVKKCADEYKKNQDIAKYSECGARCDSQ